MYPPIWLIRSFILFRNCWHVHVMVNTSRFVHTCYINLRKMYRYGWWAGPFPPNRTFPFSARFKNLAITTRVGSDGYVQSIKYFKFPVSRRNVCYLYIQFTILIVCLVAYLIIIDGPMLILWLTFNIIFSLNIILYCNSKKINWFWFLIFDFFTITIAVVW